MQRTLGGNRLGSGKKMKIGMHEYNRTTVNLSKRWSSSMAPGVLYPAYVNIGLRGDTFNIDIDAIGRTIPTKGPLFGNYKLQIDCFAAPIRLYQGLLHNNPVDLGMKMKEVKLPKFEINLFADPKSDEFNEGNMIEFNKFSNSSLIKYLGLSGPGIPTVGTNTKRLFNACPLLAYYDIFKNYYANKQEDYAYTIGNSTTKPQYMIKWAMGVIDNYTTNQVPQLIEQINIKNQWINSVNNGEELIIKDNGIYSNYIQTYKDPQTNQLAVRVLIIEIRYPQTLQLYYTNKIQPTPSNENLVVTLEQLNNKYYLIVMAKPLPNNEIIPLYTIQTKKIGLSLEKFELKEIDTMREILLKRTTLGESIIINNEEFVPGDSLWTRQENYAYQNMGGLCTKTYQSDIFNAWIKEDTINGPGSIADITRVSTAGDSFTIDALILAKKVYDMLNRIAIAGGTYQDWQDAVYTENARHVAETPIYYGGMSTDIEFEEVVQTSQGETSDPLGTLGGRGTLYKKKGGKVTIKCDEACIIMIMASITPRINYSQGNKWYMTELDSIDDLHKPALDQIGFEDLLSERLAWWSANINSKGTAFRQVIGKQPAWSNYRTDYNEVFGDFAEEASKAFMTLQRNYESKWEESKYYIKDATTYIDPSKYNYAFAYNEIDAQNFWIQIYYDIKCRRLMTAREIPNL